MAMQSPSNNPSATPQARPSYPPYQIPSTPEELAREQERIKLLLEINSELLEHVCKLQESGQGGSLPTLGAPTKEKPASMDYMLCLRATQVNVAYLAIAVQGGPSAKNRGGTLGPLLMEAPIQTPSMLAKYEALRGLFPGWKGNQQLRSPAQHGHPQQLSHPQQQQQQQQQQPQSQPQPPHQQPQQQQLQAQQQHSHQSQQQQQQQHPQQHHHQTPQQPQQQPQLHQQSPFPPHNQSQQFQQPQQMQMHQFQQQSHLPQQQQQHFQQPQRHHLQQQQQPLQQPQHHQGQMGMQMQSPFGHDLSNQFNFNMQQGGQPFQGPSSMQQMF